MKKLKFILRMVLITVAMIIFCNNSIFAQGDILDLCPTAQGQSNCMTSPAVNIPFNFDATGGDSIMVIDNISGRRVLNPTVADKQYKFCAPVDHPSICPGLGSYGADGEFHLRFTDDLGNHIDNIYKVTFRILNNSGGTITVTSYQGGVGSVVLPSTIPGGGKYTGLNSDSFVVISGYDAGITLESQLFVMDSVKIFYPDINHCPTDIILTPGNIDENQPPNTFVGRFTTVDADAGDTHTYSLVSGTGDADNASFHISNDTLYSSAMFDYETKSSYSIRVQTDDGECSTYEEQFTISINNLTGEALPEIVAVMDLSYSMNRDFDDHNTSDPDAVKLGMAKDALIGFVDILYSLNEDNVGFGFSRFPNSPQAGCDAGSVELIQTLNSTYYNRIDDTIDNRIADGGSTPILQGIDFAAHMFTTSEAKVIALLTDGRHNCPTSAISNADLQPVKDTLSEHNITLYTIGFGNETIIPNNMLNNLASASGGTHYDITATSSKGTNVFDPSNPGVWDAKASLNLAYTNILAGIPGLSSSTDPMDIINQGEIKEFKIPVTSFDNKVCFFVSWKSNQTNNLIIKLYKPDGTELSLQEQGVRVIYRESHTIIALHEDLLAQSGMLGYWTLSIDASNALADMEHYQYSVINASKNLELNTWFDKKEYYTGDNMKIFLELLVDSARYYPLDIVSIHGTQPGESFGSWLNSRVVTREQLRKVEPLVTGKKLSFEPVAARESLVIWDSTVNQNNIIKQIRRTPNNPDPIRMRSLVLMQEYKLKLPGRIKIEGLSFNDEGTDGDENAGDGLYTAMIDTLTKEGSYQFYMLASDTSHGKIVQRDKNMEAFVNVGISVVDFIDTTTHYMVAPDGRNIYMVTLSLKDAYGNIPSPEALGSVELFAQNGELIGGIIANPDGTYTQKVAVNKGVKLSKVSLTLKVNGQQGSQTLAPKPFSWKIIIVIIIIILILLLGMLKKKKKS